MNTLDTLRTVTPRRRFVGIRSHNVTERSLRRSTEYLLTRGGRRACNCREVSGARSTNGKKKTSGSQDVKPFGWMDG